VRLFTKKSRDGYLMIDHRDSPGITRDEAVKAGGMCLPIPKGTLFEAATYMCPKCQKMVIRNPDRDRSRGYCRKCDRDVCDHCAVQLKLNHTCNFDNCWHVKQITVT